MIMRAIIILLACLLLPLPAFADDSGKLLKIVALSRHGVRSPTQDAKVLSIWSQKAWPVWPVARGELTERGARLVEAMWSDLRGHFQSHKLLPEGQCPAAGTIFVRSDVDERDKATSAAILAGVAPGCSLGYALSGKKIDPLFHPVKAGLYRYDPISAATNVLTMAPGGLGKLQEDFSGPLALLDKVLGPPAPALCARFALTPNCQVADLPNAVSISSTGEEIRLVGALGIASSVAEIFLLEYAQWPGAPAGWGLVNGARLAQLLPVHARIFDVVNRAPIVSWANGSGLLKEMSLALLGRHPDKRANEAKLAVFVGHDTNIANVGALLGVTWQASGYPLNGIPPAGVLFLELWERQGQKHILARFYAQPPKALHMDFAPGEGARAHAPVAAVVSAPPVVGQARFGLSEFEALVARNTAGAPLPAPESPPLCYGPSGAPRP